MKRQRGSAMMFVVILSAAIASVVVATAELNMSAVRAQAHRYNEARMRLAFDGAAAKIDQDYETAAFALPTAHSVTVNGVTVTVNASDNSGIVPRSLRLDLLATVAGKSFADVRIIGMRKTPVPNDYALFLNTSELLDEVLTTGSGGVNGDVYIADYLWTSTNGHVINGDLETSGTVDQPNDLNVKGSMLQSVPAVPFPALNSADYFAQPHQFSAGNKSFNGYTFDNITPGGDLWYVNGDATLRNTFRNVGTIYVKGNVTINNDMSYFNASSYLMVICEGDLTINAGVNNLVGYYFVAGRVDVAGLIGSKTLTRGGIAADDLDLSEPLAINHDPEIWTNTARAIALKMPGYWP